MKRSILAVSIAAVLAVVPASAGATNAGGSHQRAPDTYITAMDEAGTAAYTASGFGPAEGHIVFGYASVATYDAVMAVHKQYQPFAVHDNPPAGTSAEAAAITAAYRIFAHYLPLQPAPAATLAAAYESSLSTIAAGPSKDQGVAVGNRVSAAFLALRADDGFRVAVPYVTPVPAIPGVWIPTPPPTNPAAPAAGTYLPAMRPLALKSSDQFRPDGPPALSSRRWARDYNETKAIGRLTGSTRTPEQTEIANFWAEAPVQQTRGAFRKFVLDHELDIVDSARFLAMESVTFADGFIACGDAKYHYAFWRPVTAIRAGDTDGNAVTVGEAGWTPLLGTPNHPEYPSAHSCLTPSAGLVISRFLGTRNIDYTVPSVSGRSDRHYATAKALREEVSNARVWGGIHFRSAVEDGSDIARQVTNYVLAHNFQKEHR
jgi:vanadium-dependent haloperoxidase-like protein